MKGLVGVCLGVWCAVVIACAAVSKTAVAPPSQQAGGREAAPAMPGSPRDAEIDKLAQEIETQRIELGIVPQRTPFTCSGAGCAQTAQQMAAGVATAPTCKPITETCTQSCTLADSICSNAKKICEIASELDGDQWAAKKCSDGNDTCQAAKKRCCDCN